VYLGKKYASPSACGLHWRRFREGRTRHIRSRGAWASTVIVIAMVATSFGTYGTALFTGGGQSATLIKLLATRLLPA